MRSRSSREGRGLKAVLSESNMIIIRRSSREGRGLKAALVRLLSLWNWSLLARGAWIESP